MDNLTHSLAGAVLGQMGLKKKTGLAMPTLIIAANIPDIDAVAVLLGGHTHLAIRRGITHGPIAMLVLPLMLWGIMLWFDRWQEKRGKRPWTRLPIHKGWLLALAYIGALSHPALDWLNSYGVRLLEPFSSQWFYGDSIFIIDIWIWIALIAGAWLSLRKERKGQGDWQRPAWIGFCFLFAYIGANIGLSSYAERKGYSEFLTHRQQVAENTVANPIPITFWQREVIIKGEGDRYSEVPYSVLSGFHWNAAKEFGIGQTDWDEIAKRDIDAKAYLFWSRMPYLAEASADCSELTEAEMTTPNSKISRSGCLVIGDARFSNPLVSDRFSLQIPIEKLERYPAPQPE